MIGRTLSHFKITAKLGEGGMGAVYRATDSKLGREVAIKVLPPAFTEDAERLARFEREARLSAQLHHPNIASIFGIEEADGTQALVMELVEGRSLEEILQAGAIPKEDALEIARQIAEALEEAHDHGIVHRDLKPANVMLTADGQVKVLDFGLAKALDPATGASGEVDASVFANSPTLVEGATQLGVILGTAAYMAPEQARGAPVDRRVDIWAFGVVLYEMLSREKLFVGDTVPDIMAQVLTRDVDLEALPADVPAPIRRLLRRCLARQPRERLRDAGDARIVLSEVLGGEVVEAAPAEVEGRASGRWVWVGAAGGVLVGALLGGLVWNREPPPRQQLELGLALPVGHRLSLTDTPLIALSRDARYLAMATFDESDRRILLYDFMNGTVGHIEGTEGGSSPVFSPDSKSLAYVSGAVLYRLVVAGGPSLRVTDIGPNFRGMAWNDDGFIYFAPDAATEIYRVSAEGGEPVEVTRLDEDRDERTHRWPAPLPDGAVLYTSDTTATTEEYDDARIEAVRPATGAHTIVLEGASSAKFLPPDRLLFARGGDLYVIGFDPRSLATRGEASLFEASVVIRKDSGAASFDIAESGAGVWLAGDPGGGDRVLEWVDRDGRVTRSPMPEGRYSQIALSPDGKQVASTMFGRRTRELWMGNLELGSPLRLTFDGSVEKVVWTRDGTRVAYSFTSEDGSENDLYWRAADGSDDPELLFASPWTDLPCFFGPRDEFLLLAKTQGALSDIVRVSVGSQNAEAVLDDPAMEIHAALSPDGRWLAYASNEFGGGHEVIVRSYPSLAGKWVVSDGGGRQPQWSPDGRTLYFYRNNRVYRVAITPGASFIPGRPEVAAVDVVDSESNSYAVGPDGRLLVIRPAQLAINSPEVKFASRWGARPR